MILQLRFMVMAAKLGLRYYGVLSGDPPSDGPPPAHQPPSAAGFNEAYAHLDIDEIVAVIRKEVDGR